MAPPVKHHHSSTHPWAIYSQNGWKNQDKPDPITSRRRLWPPKCLLVFEAPIVGTLDLLRFLCTVDVAWSMVCSWHERPVCYNCFDFPCCSWVLVNRFQMGHGQCAASLHIWGQQEDPTCTCGQRQRMACITYDCPLTRFDGDPKALFFIDESASNWLGQLCVQ